MLLETPLIKLAELDREIFQNIKDQVKNISPETWDEDTSRQDSFRCHRDTQAIPLIYGRNINKKTYTEHWNNTWEKKFLPLLSNILNPYYGEGEIIRMCLCNLLPFGTVLEHKDDTEEILLHTHRIHLPIITNINVDFIVEQDVFNLKEGCLYEFSNQQFHHVKNRSALNRVHLIFDYLELDKIQFFEKKYLHTEPISQPTSYRDQETGELIKGES